MLSVFALLPAFPSVSAAAFAKIPSPEICAAGFDGTADVSMRASPSVGCDIDDETGEAGNSFERQNFPRPHSDIQPAMPIIRQQYYYHSKYVID